MRSPSSLFRGAMLATPLLVAGLCVPAAAGEGAVSTLGTDWVAIDPAMLEDMRGGFQTASGMSLSFGVERAVLVNGELLATTRVNIPDIARMTTDQAQELARFNQGQVIQVGDGNTFEPANNFNGLVIQNTRDGQDIRALTTINVGVDTLGMFQSLNTQAAMHDAMVAATSP